MAIFFSTRVKVGAKGGAELAGNLRSLLNKNSSAWRTECIEKNGVQVFYIRDRNIFDYIFENLDAHESELIRMRNNARAVLEFRIRPFITGEKFWDGEGIALWKKIEDRILDCHAPDERKSKSHLLYGCELMHVKTSDQLLSVPDGLSICNASPSKFIARKILPAEDRLSDQNRTLRNKNIIMKCEKWPDVEKNGGTPRKKNIKSFYLNALRNSCTDIKANYFSVVIEPILHPLDENRKLSEKHVGGLLDAVTEFIEGNKRLKKTVSLVIATENSSWYVQLRNKILNNANLRRDEIENPDKIGIMDRFTSPSNSFQKYERRTSVSNISPVQKSSDLLSTSDDER